MTRAPAPRERLRQLALLAGLTLLYFFAGKFGLTFAVVHSNASAVWPPTGIAIGALMLFGRGMWPAILAGAFLVNVTTGGSPLTAAGIAVGNTLEAVVGAGLAMRFAGGLACFETARGIFQFALLSALLATLISATLGVSSLALGGYAPWAEYSRIWLNWWLGNVVGALVVTPLIVLLARELRPRWTAERLAELLLLLLTAVLVSTVVFQGAQPLAFLCLPPLAWAAFRFGSREVAGVIVLIAANATLGTARLAGPFASLGAELGLLVLQLFLGTITLTFLPIAALVREHRRALAEAAGANRAKDEFLAMLSHELRNPLQAIGNAVYLLRERGGDEISREAVDIVRRQTDHLARLVNDLLDVTRTLEGKTVLVHQPLDLHTLARDCIAVQLAAGRARGHALELRGTPAWVQADPARMEQVVTNLLVNAIKFTPPGGRIVVTTGVERDAAVLHVEDNGIGIPPDFLPRVFDLFTQGERGLDRTQGGLGIGLTLVRRLVEQQRGRVEASSDGPGQGSRFTVRLPVGRPPQHVAAAAQLAPAPVTPRRVLVIEDNADARHSLRNLLQLLGHEVLEAGDGESGVEQAQRHRPDVALVDIGLPRMDGYAVARALRGHAALRLVAVTGYGRDEDRQRARDAGFDEHLVKPVRLDDLQRVLAGARR